MDVGQVLSQLEQWGNDTRKKMNLKNGAGDNCFGVLLGDLRKYAKEIKTDHSLALGLWDSGNTDAMILATMLFDVKSLSEEQVRNMVGGLHYFALVDELIYNAVSKTAFSDALMREWIGSPEEYIGRAGFALAISEIIDNRLSDDVLENLLAIIEADMKSAPARKQESMNRTLCEIGIRHPEYTDRCAAIGEKLGVYKDMKVSKGCTSPYAPEWIAVGIKKRKK
jgi:3-methyladenine DNA glycosylase AlkD